MDREKIVDKEHTERQTWSRWYINPNSSNLFLFTKNLLINKLNSYVLIINDKSQRSIEASSRERESSNSVRVRESSEGGFTVEGRGRESVLR